jgi:anti-sigma factor ChrR (cupin superfamily)
MLNMEFSERVVVDTSSADWIPSPASGVWRKPLAREQAEQGHATSVVRYDAGASFSQHDHPLGEEILVLSGVFSDETRDYPAGTYFRNPKGFVHSPFSRDGCTLFVKLHQMSPEDRSHICLATDDVHWENGPGGTLFNILHKFKGETVYLVKWSPGVTVPSHTHPAGEETFIISGELIDEDGRYPAGTCIRNPPGSSHSPRAEVETVAWIKAGHLGH